MNTIAIPQTEVNVIALLNQHQVQYLIVGGHAVRYYGCDRTTKDLDLLCSPFDNNPERVFPVLREMIGGTPRFTTDDLRCENKQLNFKVNGRSLDILTSIHGVNTKEALSGKTVVSNNDVQYPFISRKHLISNLKASLQFHDRSEKAASDLKCLGEKGA